MDLDKNNELDQANLRVIVACCALVYMTVLGFLPGSSPAPYLPVIYYIVTFVLVSIGLRQAIARWPGNYPWRRVLGMVHDYTGTCFGLVVGGEAALPIYAVMVWVNLGNGMRFGSRYLAIATVLALAALLVVYQITPYWQANPFMVLMLLTTSTVIPVYAHLLLERTRKASEQAAAANREKSRFLAQASHDLRQPIHSIGLFTACLREAQLGEEERRLVDSIDRSLLNVSQLFARFSTFTPWTTGACNRAARHSPWPDFWRSWCVRTPSPPAGPGWRYACGPARTGRAPTAAC